MKTGSTCRAAKPFWVWVCIALLVAVANAHAADPKAAVALEVSARSIGINRAGDPSYVVVVLKNTSGETIKLKNLSIVVDSALQDRYLEPFECEIDYGEPVIPAGLSMEQQCRFLMKSGLPWRPDSDWRNLLLSADLSLVVTASSYISNPRTYFPVVPIKAGQFGVFAGGLAGALLLAFFIWIERVLTQSDVRQAWGRNLLVMGALGLRGGLMAIMALLLGSTTQGVGSPVTLTVSDFSGGVLIGLFSYPLATWISSTLKLDGGLIFSKPPRKKKAPNGASGSQDTAVVDAAKGV